VDKYTVGGHASLASVSEFGSHDTLNSSREIGSWEYDVGRVATEFQSKSFDGAGRLLVKYFTNSSRSFSVKRFKFG
jgi:hypothetical protein